MHKKFLLVDTPGHGKLRHHALDNITSPQNLRGVIFLVDAASLSTGDESVWQTSEYLHDILLLLQKRGTGSKTSKAPKEISLLIAAGSTSQDYTRG
jgi:signal recognition particle receptor subunit beta